MRFAHRVSHQAPSLSPCRDDGVKRFGLRNRDIATADEVWSFVMDFTR
jgi:hypothetical protein